MCQAGRPSNPRLLLYLGVQGIDEEVGQSLVQHSAMMRFAAHFVLALRALEAAPDSSPELDFATLEVRYEPRLPFPSIALLLIGYSAKLNQRRPSQAHLLSPEASLWSAVVVQ